MDLHHLKYFIEVARHKSFTKAAEICCVSQSAISKTIKDLEAELGTVLFNRNSKYVHLTDAGLIFLSQSQQIVSMFRNLKTDFENELKLEKGKITIGLPPITGVSIFAQLLANFRKKHPQVEIELYEYGSKKVVIGIQDGTLDLGVICNLPNNDMFETMTLSNDPLCVVTHPQHDISKLPSVNLASLTTESFVLYTKDFSLHEEIVNNCKLAGFQPKIVFETSQLELMIQMVAANLGIALLPSKTCERLDASRTIAIPLLKPTIFHKMSIIWRKGHYMSHAARLWLTNAEEYFKEEKLLF
ncbi:HTH-type transcriptional regulator GltC [bioreactor metagenome]|uniref:HTH-type transcriptional regulator GltC n=1 Tax=bioreactor metagenome TaxID=1076179 RepID=A0A644TMR0_9ZZZZ|nr:LysR family transcriptional regulator [Negativicutes bacterium]